MSIIKASTHAFANQLLALSEGPIRMITIGKFAVIWDGKPGDYLKTVDTREFLSLEDIND